VVLAGTVTAEVVVKYTMEVSVVDGTTKMVPFGRITAELLAL
jgi:hypothetical protein